MRHRHDTPSDAVRQPGWALGLADALGLIDYADRAPRTLLARCLLVAAALGCAVSAVARRAARLGRETVRKGLATSLPPDTRALEARLAAALRRTAPRRSRPVLVAIDIHRRPYYGNRRTPGITGGKAEAGARWFWSYATAVSLRRGRRHTLAVTAINAADTLTDVVERVLAQVAHTGVRVRCVLLDRAFYAVGVVNALRRRKLRFVIPMVCRGVEARKLFRRGCRGWFEHTFSARRREEGTATVCAAVVPGPNGNRPLVFACSHRWSGLSWVALVYGRRFGIESSYRQLGACLAVTTSRDAVYRLLLVCASVLLREWWLLGAARTVNDLRLDILLALGSPDTERAQPAQLPLAQPPTRT